MNMFNYSGTINVMSLQEKRAIAAGLLRRVRKQVREGIDIEVKNIKTNELLECS